MARSLLSTEFAFLHGLFGDSLPYERLRLARSLHPRRCWSPFGARISLTASCFEGNDPLRGVALDRPSVAATFAHEALHVWQRTQGRWVTWEGARLQVPYALFARNPYHYDPSSDPGELLQTFLSGNIEQQGQLFEDYVFGLRKGDDVSAFREVAAHVHGARCMTSPIGTGALEL